MFAKIEVDSAFIPWLPIDDLEWMLRWLNVSFSNPQKSLKNSLRWSKCFFTIDKLNSSAFDDERSFEKTANILIVLMKSVW